LRDEQHAMVRSHMCPEGHGLLLEEANLRQVVGSDTIERLHELIEGAAPAGLDCPVCMQALSGVRVQDVPARGCSVCGALWFDAGAIEGHVRDVRRRESGAASFTARYDVARLGADLQPTEVVAGLLAFYELEPTGSPSNA
jgi:Zn-finger nucleic acid-binding protein